VCKKKYELLYVEEGKSRKIERLGRQSRADFANDLTRDKINLLLEIRKIEEDTRGNALNLNILLANLCSGISAVIVSSCGNSSKHGCGD
jgi:hypothetical protein